MNALPISIPAERYRKHSDAIEDAVAKVLRSGQYILGGEVTAFENEFAAFLGAAQCIGVASGTDALELALRASGVGPGDGVITVAHTAVATVSAIERAGAVPAFVDVDPVTFTMAPAALEEMIRECRRTKVGNRPRLRAIVPVHLYGHPADMPAILAIARAHRLLVVEDCAQAHGASFSGRMTGTWGDCAAFSFYPTKNLGAFGDAGAVVTNQPKIAEKVRLLREYGWRTRNISEVPGMNSRLDEIQAAILRKLLPHLNDENAVRRRWADEYARRLATAELVLPYTCTEVVHAFHQFVVRTPQRDALQKDLQSRGITTQIHYPVPIHRQPAYRRRCLVPRRGLPNTDAAARQVLSLPMSPHLKHKHIHEISEAILDALRSQAQSR